jgi:hypothetical protein
VQAIRLFAAAVVGAMVVAIAGGFQAGDLTGEGAALLELVWGRVTVVDIYLAFLIGWVWIAARERSVASAAGWLIAVLVTGSLALGIYLLGASVRASTPSELLLGPGRPKPVAPAPG